MSYVTRAKSIIRDIRRHDAPATTNAALTEFGQAVLYSSVQEWGEIVEARGWTINPDNLNVLDDVGTPGVVGVPGVPAVLDDPETPEDESSPAIPAIPAIPFEPASPTEINDAIASLFIQKIRGEMKSWLRAYRLVTDSPTVLGPLADSRAEVLATAEIDATAIVGDNADDPNN